MDNNPVTKKAFKEGIALLTYAAQKMGYDISVICDADYGVDDPNSAVIGFVIHAPSLDIQEIAERANIEIIPADEDDDEEDKPAKDLQ